MKMNPTEFREDNNIDETNTKVTIVKVETYHEDDLLDCSAAVSGRKHVSNCTLVGQPEPNKRKQSSLIYDGQMSEPETITTVKKRRLIPESLLLTMRNKDCGSGSQANADLSSTNSDYSTTSQCEGEETVSEFASSYKKPLYGISHKITEKKNPVTSDLLASYELYDKANQGSPSNLRVFNDLRKRDSSPALITSGNEESNIYSLIQKMFFTLNTLNSNMSQLHSKVDLLSLEVSRIKKKVSPQELVAEFQPPPEYQLTSTELKQVMDQSNSAGDLACRLLVQLFPELFGSDSYSRNCSTCGYINKTKLESLHLQLIRNYVEVCYPSVKNTGIWQVECLPQLNDFFNRFWAQREMEVSRQNMQSSSFFETQSDPSSHFIENKEQEENSSVDRTDSVISEYVLNPQDLNELLDEASSPGEFAVFLLHRLFSEIFDQRKLADHCNREPENFILDPHRLQLIRRYTEIYFPDVQEEEVWLQQCVQRINDELESVLIDGSEYDDMGDDCYDSSSLPDDLSIVKVEDGIDSEKPGRRSKKIWLVPFDFDKIDIPPPDFEVPFPQFLLSKEQLKNIYESSLSIGNFASRLLVHLFPELFTPENLRKQYNCSGSLGKKQLDPIRVKLIRHYVQILYPRAKNDRVWTLEFVGKLDERCRRRDTEQRRSYQQQRKFYVPVPERRDFVPFELNPERFRDLIDGPPLPPERSSKDFCKIPLDKIVVPSPEFPVPSIYLLNDKEIRDIVQQSLSVGNFAARLLVRLFPELFTPENLRLQYNHSGACNKKQLDPLRLRLIRHYVEAVYPVDKMEEVWHYECIPSIDERCRRPNRKKCDILKKAKKAKKNT